MARFCMRLVRDQANVRQRLLRLIDIGLPELKEAFEDPTCDTALAVLREAPPVRWAVRRRVSALADAIRPGEVERLDKTLWDLSSCLRHGWGPSSMGTAPALHRSIRPTSPQGE